MLAHPIALADLRRPPDTSSLPACGPEITAAAITALRLKLARRSRSFSLDPARPDAAAVALRRLRDPRLAAYALCEKIVLSEPFNAIACSVSPAPLGTARHHVSAMLGARPPAPLVRALATFGERALAAARANGVRLFIVPSGVRYADVSPIVRRCAPGIDDWPAPPSGLFVVEEKRVLLRDRALAMTAAHEFAHALDAVLATKPRSYFSFESDDVRNCFANAVAFVNEYAASGLDEYFAESVRAYLEVNDPRCAWPPLTRSDLLARDPAMFALVERVFASLGEAIAS